MERKRQPTCPDHGSLVTQIGAPQPHFGGLSIPFIFKTWVGIPMSLLQICSRQHGRLRTWIYGILLLYSMNYFRDPQVKANRSVKEGPILRIRTR